MASFSVFSPNSSLHSGTNSLTLSEYSIQPRTEKGGRKWGVGEELCSRMEGRKKTRKEGWVLEPHGFVGNEGEKGAGKDFLAGQYQILSTPERNFFSQNQ